LSLRDFKRWSVVTAASLCGVVARSTSQKRSTLPYIDVVSMHGTPVHVADRLKRLLEWLLRDRVPATMQDVRSAVQGNYASSKPGLLVCLDDGRRDNFEVAAPLLEKFGLRGVFFVPVDFVDCPESEQPRFVKQHNISYGTSEPDVHAMTWPQVRELHARGHSIGGHTSSHRRMPPGVPATDLEYELVRSRRVLEDRLSAPVESFCWVGGEAHNYSVEAAAIVQQQYPMAFTSFYGPVRNHDNPHFLRRHNIEADWSLRRVDFYLSGIMERKYQSRSARTWERVFAGLVNSRPISSQP